MHTWDDVGSTRRNRRFSRRKIPEPGLLPMVCTVSVRLWYHGPGLLKITLRTLHYTRWSGPFAAIWCGQCQHGQSELQSQEVINFVYISSLVRKTIIWAFCWLSWQSRRFATSTCTNHLWRIWTSFPHASNLVAAFFEAPAKSCSESSLPHWGTACRWPPEAPATLGCTKYTPATSLTGQPQESTTNETNAVSKQNTENNNQKKKKKRKIIAAPAPTIVATPTHLH